MRHLAWRAVRLTSKPCYGGRVLQKDQERGGVTLPHSWLTTFSKTNGAVTVWPRSSASYAMCRPTVPLAPNSASEGNVVAPAVRAKAMASLRFRKATPRL